MKIAFNPSTVAALIAPPNNKDITFDLRGHNIFARGVKFCGTDTNTWRDIKINNVSIDSNILDLRDGDNTTLTNINGVVTINSTWRPVVDNLTSDSTTSSLSANLGRILKALIDDKSDSGHTHDDRYLRLTGGTMNGNARIGHGSGNLYIGNSGNDGWIAVQDICSQNSIGDGKWSIRVDGTATFQSIKFPSNRLITQVSNGSNSPLKGIKLPNLLSNAIGIFSRVGNGSDEGGIVLSEDTCVIYNSFDTGWGLSVRDKDINLTDISGDNTIAFGIRQDYRAYSLGGFEKSGSDNTYVLLGGGDHKLESSLNVASASVASKVYGQVGDTGSHELVRCDMNNDQFRIIAGSNGNNNGWAEIATADDGNEPIYVRQYTGVFSSVVRTLTLLDANGYTHFPSYINIGGNENNNSSPDRVWGSNSSDSYLRSYRTSALSVNYASSAGNADTVDNIHATGFLRWKGMLNIGNNAPFQAVVDIIKDTSKLNDGGLSFYSYAGDEYTVLIGSRNDATRHGNALKWGYANKYLWMIRMINGSPKSSDWEKISAGYADSAGSVSWNNITGKPSSYTPSAHTHTVFNNNLMIKGTNGISDSASIHLGIGDSDTGFKWISDGVCQIYANNVAVGEWTSGGMNWFINPTVNGNKVWNAGNDGSGSELDADTVDGYHASKFPYINNNGIWRIYGNAAVDALADNTAGLSSWAFGESRNYGITYLGILKPSTATCGISANGTIAVFGQGDTHLGIASDYGSANLQVFGGNADKIVWRKKVAFTSDIPTVTNYYWANVKISASSSTTTSPTVSNLTATNSIRMDNILLGHTDEINNITNGNIYLNYRTSGNVSLCLGGGNVGIGTTSPSYKLDVNGLMRASGFHHSSMDSNNYMLLAGGGYKSFGGNYDNPIFLGYLNLDHGDDGTISSSFYCLGYSVSFTYTRGGNYCKIYIPDTSYQTFYIRAATASVNYSGGGMDTWTGYRRGDGAWWLHCYAYSSNEVRVKGFRLANDANDSWWGGNPLWSSNGGANRITVCIFGYVTFK